MNRYVEKTVRCKQMLSIDKWPTPGFFMLDDIFHEHFQWSSLGAISLRVRHGGDLELINSVLSKSLHQIDIQCQALDTTSFKNFISFHSQLTGLSLKWLNGTLFTSGMVSIIARIRFF